ncbi:hypothetical protein HJG60_008832 [Phyllostomus discolor]|uniref:Uncharacterized protein n=1 Tax=Phyllostomus discolor TaxID=89673 RepID=A0A833YTG5_9CHIR|nr:hypothetical protein HJG60_008832 [Phyllostomus discolor]
MLLGHTREGLGLGDPRQGTGEAQGQDAPRWETPVQASPLAWGSLPPGRTCCSLSDAGTVSIGQLPALGRYPPPPHGASRTDTPACLLPPLSPPPPTPWASSPSAESGGEEPGSGAEMSLGHGDARSPGLLTVTRGGGDVPCTHVTNPTWLNGAGSHLQLGQAGWHVFESEKPGMAILGVLSPHGTDSLQALGAPTTPGASVPARLPSHWERGGRMHTFPNSRWQPQRGRGWRKLRRPGQTAREDGYQGVLVSGLPLTAPRWSDRAGAGRLCCHTVEYYTAEKKD